METIGFHQNSRWIQPDGAATPNSHCCKRHLTKNTGIAEKGHHVVTLEFEPLKIDPNPVMVLWKRTP